MKTTILLILAFSGCDERTRIACEPLTAEQAVIVSAAARNGVTSEFDLKLLFAIRKAENGGPGREMGIMNPKAYNLDLQAAWAACTIRNQHRRHEAHDCGLDYIACLARRYCPVGAENDPDGLNINWERNVRFFMND